MEDHITCQPKPTVVVTGFAPFGDLKVNASWEGVRRMNKEELEKKHNINLRLIEVPVVYESVDKRVPTLWETYAPKLIIHVGVASGTQCFTLEVLANREGYEIPDAQNKWPADLTCAADGPKEIFTMINMLRVCEKFNDPNSGGDCDNTRAMISDCAGRYLCEYIFYSSLSVDNTRTVFVHVPDEECYSSEQTARGLERLLALCLEQLREDENFLNGQKSK